MDERQRLSIYKKMCKKIDNILQVGDEFIIEDLLSPKEWSNLIVEERQGLGRFFSKKVKDKELDNVKLINPKQKGKNKYRKI